MGIFIGGPMHGERVSENLASRPYLEVADPAGLAFGAVRYRRERYGFDLENGGDTEVFFVWPKHPAESVTEDVQQWFRNHAAIDQLEGTAAMLAVLLGDIYDLAPEKVKNRITQEIGQIHQCLRNVKAMNF